MNRTLVAIRERSYLDILDLALLVLRSRPRPLIAAAAAGVLPPALFNGCLLADPEFPPGAWLVLFFFETPWATAPLTLVLGGLMFGRATGGWTVARRVLRAFPKLFLTHVILRGILTVTFLLIWLVPGRFGFANEVILLESRGPIRSLRRMSQLARGRTGEMILQWLGQVTLGLVFAACFWLGTGAVTSALFSSEITWQRPALGDIGGVRFQLGLWIAVTFFALARFFVYLDQRIRMEGWEVRLRIQAAARDLEGGRTWSA